MDPADYEKLLRYATRRTGPKHARTVIKESPQDKSQELAKYKHDPVGFARDVLGVELTEDQIEIAGAFPGRVKVNSAHSVGKSFLAAVLALHRYYCFNPGVVIITAPTKDHVETVLWAEIRMLLAGAKIKPVGDLAPKAALLFDTDDHWIKGYTSRSGEAFQGRHRSAMFFIMDESEDVGAIYWTTTNTMYQPQSEHGWFAIGNPLTTGSQSAIEDEAEAPDGSKKWKLFSLSALDHPNIKAQLQGQPPIIPNAVTLSMVEQWVKDWTDPVSESDRLPTDVEWPIGSSKYVRPGPQFLARVLGLRPLTGVDTVWSQLAWERAVTPKYDEEYCWTHKCGITIGIDSAAYGNDDSCLHVRSGPLSLHHEAHNGWLPDRTAARAKELAELWALKYNSWAVFPSAPKLRPDQVQVNIELDGMGIGVYSHCNNFGNWQGIVVGEGCDELDSTGRPLYRQKRSQMWFNGKKKAMLSEMDLSRLPQDVLKRLKMQLLAPTYEVQTDGSLQVEAKKDIKERLGRSPDDGDALLLCYYEVSRDLPTLVGKGVGEPAPSQKTPFLELRRFGT